jgi:hypothetical protein
MDSLMLPAGVVNQNIQPAQLSDRLFNQGIAK